LNTYGLRLNLQQPIFTGFRLKSSVEVARFNLAASTVGYQQQRMELVYEIKKAYWQLYLTREMVVVLTENVKAVETHLKDARNFFRQGLITQEDVLRTEARLSNSELQLSETQNRVKMAELNLNHILGLPLDAQIQLNSRLNPDETEIAALNPKAVDLALERRPEIQAAEFRLRAAQSSLTLAKSGYFPQLFLNGNYNYDRPNQRILPAEDKFRDTWDLSLALSFELWNWGKTANLKQQAEARLKQSQQTMNNLKDLITLEINQSYLNLDQAHQALALTEKIVQQSEENHRMVQNKFKLGVASNSELLDAEVELLQAKIGYTNALVDFKLAEAWWAKSLSQD
jgi:outer membrane protein TolC